MDGDDAVSTGGLRLGGIVTFCCSLSRLAAVQGSSLIASLPRFVRRVERSEYNTRPEGNAGLFLATKRWCTGPSQSRPFSVLARAVSNGWKAYPALLLVGWRLCAGLSVHNFRYWRSSGNAAAVPVRSLAFTEPTQRSLIRAFTKRAVGVCEWPPCPPGRGAYSRGPTPFRCSDCRPLPGRAFCAACRGIHR